tara:strand:+ start:116 stop:286 length:171 start_codon:yes stop_codon:yes gene_type:complete
MNEKMFIDVEWVQRKIPKVWESTFCSMGDYLEFINQDDVIEVSASVRRFTEDSMGW